MNETLARILGMETGLRIAVKDSLYGKSTEDMIAWLDVVRAMDAAAGDRQSTIIRENTAGYLDGYRLGMNTMEAS